MSIVKANQILQEVFGYGSFRHSQKAIIESIFEKRNTLAIMPTGGGKSLCYQIPAIMAEGLTLVISPLISLMEDQVRQLLEWNVPAAMLNSALSAETYQNTLDDIRRGKVSLLFLAPETILQATVLNTLKQINVSYLAIDEAHCISEWGHEFRPEYRQLFQLTDDFPRAVVIALTATATPRVREDIKQQLGIANSSEFISSFDRPNLFIQVLAKDSPYRQATEFIEQHSGQSGIIYCQSRAAVNELSQKLQDDGYSSLPYHAGLNSQKRSAHQDKFVRDDVHIIVATIAFGMGINKPDVRFVLHYDLPKNIESYYQQIGRAGRDGLDANCLLLFGYGDTGKIRYFIDQMMNEQEKRLATLHLNQMLGLAETETCRRLPLLQYFGEPHTGENCQKCDNCLSDDIEKQDLTVPAQKFLSCVHRTGQRFGANHIIDVLRGSNAEKILQNQHNLLSTYNIGNEYTKKQWMVLSRQLIQKGLLKQDEQFGSLKLTQEAGQVLKGKVSFFALLQQENSSKQSAGSTTVVSGDQVLLQQLKAHRKTLADTANLPPYAIFSDRSLQEMAHYFPHSPASFINIHGVGQAKLDKYASEFLAIIKAYCSQHALKEISNTQSTPLPKKAANKDELGQKSINIVKSFEQGRTINQLITQHKVKYNTIVGHLYKFVAAGRKLSNIEHLITAIDLKQAEMSAVKSAFEKHGNERLRPVFEALGEAISYEKLHLLRIYFMHSKL